MVDFAKTRDNVKEYYGRVLQNKRDLSAEAWCAATRRPCCKRHVMHLTSR